MRPDYITSYVDTEGMCRRIKKLVQFKLPDKHIYAFDMLPSGGQWGRRSAFGTDSSSLMCAAGTNEPYTVWITGRVSRTYFVTRQGQPQPQVAMNIMPWSIGTLARVKQLLAKSCVPNTSECRSLPRENRP